MLSKKLINGKAYFSVWEASAMQEPLMQEGRNRMYKAKILAKYIVSKCTEEGHPVTNLQLQMILYFIQINFMKIFNITAFDEDIEAWRLGPAIPEVYNEYAYCAGTPIYDTCNEINNAISGTEKEVIDTIIDMLRDKFTWDLAKACTEQGTPYRQVYYGTKIRIPKKCLYEYAKNLTEKK